MKSNIFSNQSASANNDGCELNIGKRIREQRMKRKLTQQQLADKLYYTVDSIKKIESGDRIPTIDGAKAFKHFFNVSYDYLLDGKTEPVSIDSLLEAFSKLNNEEQGDFLKYAIDILNQGR